MKNELHNSSYVDVSSFKNNEGHCGLLRSNEALQGSGPVLSKDTLDALEELGVIIKSIRIRMYNEGYEIVNGVVQKKNPECI